MDIKKAIKTMEHWIEYEKKNQKEVNRAYSMLFDVIKTKES